jgi:hypothetical protein
MHNLWCKIVSFAPSNFIYKHLLDAEYQKHSDHRAR